MARRLLLVLALNLVSDWANSNIIPDNLFTNGDSEYKSLLVNPKTSSLYVGAQGNLFKLWLYNVNDTNLFAKRSLAISREDLDDCMNQGSTKKECEVRVQSQFLKSDGNILVCLSNGMKPVLHQVDGASLKDIELPKTAIGVCSPHSEVNTTAVFVEFGNPDDIPAIYSGIRTGQSLENHLIYRPALVFNNKEVHGALRTVYTDSKWLNDPQFVASFSINQYVYFFIREVAVEADNCGRNVYSRVVRVCKSDLGGKNVLRQVWSSFVKARLNCSSGSFAFNYLNSMTLVDTGSDQLFYGVFSSSEGPLQASAVCQFSFRAINQLFDTGIFLEQPSVHSIWQPTPLEKIPTYRPGSCAADSRTLSDSELHFAKSHMLMSESVQSEIPAFVFEGKSLNKILADPKEGQTVLFLYNKQTNTVQKVLHWYDQQEYRILDTFELPGGYGAVNDLAILPGEYLFVASDSNVAQYRLGQCSNHETCWGCSSDPYCSWSIARSECFSRDSVHSTSVGWVTDVTNTHRCRNYIRSLEKRIYPGDGVLLQCPAKSSGSQWRVDNVPITKDSHHLVLSLKGDLVLLNVTRQESGTYQCVQDNQVLFEYIVMVDDSDCSQPKSVAQFHSIQREWCKKFEFYKSNASKYQKYLNENSECPRVPSEMQSKKVALN